MTDQLRTDVPGGIGSGIDAEGQVHDVRAGRPRRGPAIVAEGEAILVVARGGVEVRHVLGRGIMLRMLSLPTGASLDIAESAAEHILAVVAGDVLVHIDGRPHPLRVAEVMLLPKGGPFTIVALGRWGADCQLVSSPSDTELVRRLMHLEHEGHGFD